MSFDSTGLTGGWREYPAFQVAPKRDMWLVPVLLIGLVICIGIGVIRDRVRHKGAQGAAVESSDGQYNTIEVSRW